MATSYKKLWKKLIDLDMKKKDNEVCQGIKPSKIKGLRA